MTFNIWKKYCISLVLFILMRYKIENKSIDLCISLGDLEFSESYNEKNIIREIHDTYIITYA